MHLNLIRRVVIVYLSNFIWMVLILMINKRDFPEVVL
uniref:Uncharacterized protein n=1 Tax=Rhizophora mucronata TaxID=61149 RepID=A0A2P2NB68_RHIMU